MGGEGGEGGEGREVGLGSGLRLSLRLEGLFWGRGGRCCCCCCCCLREGEGGKGGRVDWSLL